MRPTNLRDYLGEFEPTRIALLSRRGSVSYGGLTETRWAGSAEASVAVLCKDPEVIAKALVALDGAVRALCAIPVSLNPDEINALLRQWRFDIVITDQDASRREVFEQNGLTWLSPSEVFEVGSAQEGPAAETKWLVPTSGTTAAPKLVVYRFESLARVAIAGRKPGETQQTWAMLYDLTRFAGYQVFFQALLSGHKLVLDDLDSPVGERVALLVAETVTHLSATPTLWRKILMSPAHRDLAPLQITLGGEAADQPTLTALGEAFPGARVTHVFASTEAGVGMAVSDGRAGFPLSYTERSFDGVDIRLANDRLQVRAAAGASTYAGDVQLTDADGWIDTGDLVRVEGDRFFVVGRESGVINVGGDKVVPEQVRDALLACDLVLEAMVYAKKNPFTGAIVAADVVLRDSEMESSEARMVIDSHLAERLTSTQRPRFLRFVPDIKTTATGKVITKP